MKKTLLFLLFTLILSAPLYSQSKSNQHLKFMGIPIDGSITNFQNKLIAKGFKYDQTTSKAVEGPTRFYNGQFAGETVMLIVYYDRDQKFVYRVKAVVDCSTADLANSKMCMFRNQLIEKYNTSAEEGQYEGNESYYIPLANGWVDLFYNQKTYDVGYSLHLDYWDAVNTQKNQRNNMDDL